MKISKKTQYGLRALVYLAQNNFSSIKKIATEEKIPYYYLEKIFSQLEKANIIKGKKGALGGYSLVKKNIKLNEIFQALDEKMLLVSCLDKNNKCFKEKTCLTKKLWQNLQKKQQDYFNSITLKDLIK